MKYSQEITINLPRKIVIELFDSEENLKKWQPGLISFEHVSGKKGTKGAKSKLLFDENGRKIEMIETILVSNFPDEFSSKYDAKGVENWSENHFSEDGNNKTIWRTENEFKFSGMMKIMGWLMPGSFKKQSYKYLEYFKEFAESA